MKTRALEARHDPNRRARPWTIHIDGQVLCDKRGTVRRFATRKAALKAAAQSPHLTRGILTMIDRKRELLEKIAAEGKATRLLDEELATAKTLEADGLLFLVGLIAVVTPKGRKALAEI